MVYDVTEIFEQINGYGGVCCPATDNNGRKILSPDALNDQLLAEIKPIIEQCTLIEHVPLKFDL